MRKLVIETTTDTTLWGLGFDIDIEPVNERYKLWITFVFLCFCIDIKIKK